MTEAEARATMAQATKLLDQARETGDHRLAIQALALLEEVEAFLRDNDMFPTLH